MTMYLPTKFPFISFLLQIGRIGLPSGVSSPSLGTITTNTLYHLSSSSPSQPPPLSAMFSSSCLVLPPIKNLGQRILRCHFFATSRMAARLLNILSNLTQLELWNCVDAVGDRC